MLIEHVGDEAEHVTDIKNVGYCCYLDAQSNAGDPEAQYCLADALYYGRLGLEEDEEKALSWMTEAAKQGYPEAECEIALWHCYGLCGLEEDESRAIEILETAKALGDYFPCEISSRIANAGSIQQAASAGVVEEMPVQDQELGRLLTEPNFAICLLQTGDHLAFWQNVSMGNTTLLNCGRSLVLSIPRNVFSSDVRPILIKQFVEKIKEMQTIILMKEFLLHAVRDCLPTGGDESLAAIVMKQNYIRKIHIFLMKANESIRMIMQILIRLEKGDDAAALTLMQKNNERISCNVTLLIDSVFGEIIEDEGIYTQLHIDHHAGCSGRLIVSEREIEEDDYGVLKGTMATAARKAQDTGILMMIGLTTPSENPDVTHTFVHSFHTPVKTSLSGNSKIREFDDDNKLSSSPSQRNL